VNINSSLKEKVIENMNILRLINISTFFIFFTACSSADQAPQTQQQKTTNAPALLNVAEDKEIIQEKKAVVLPNLVLVGTDVISLGDYKFQDIKIESLPGEYYAEMGGAEIHLTISFSDNQLSIKRTFIAPGLEPQVKIYGATQSDSQSFSQPNELSGKIVKGGVLLFEAASGVDGIPDTLWIFYSK
jgi:hypothetical protein